MPHSARSYCPVPLGRLTGYDLAMTRLMIFVICCLALAAPAWAGFGEGGHAAHDALSTVSVPS